MAKSVVAQSILASLVLLSSSAWAINYDDPNLSDRRDVVARAALNCNAFRSMREQFDACLVSQGVTDMSEKTEAASIARAVPVSVGPSLTEGSVAKPAHTSMGSKGSK